MNGSRTCCATVVCGALLFATRTEGAAPFERVKLDPNEAATISDPISAIIPVDLQVALTGLAVTAAPMLVKDSRATAYRLLLPEHVNGLDRSVIGNRSAAAKTASDVLLFSSIILPHVANALDAWLSDSGASFGLGHDSAILVESLAVTGMLSTVVKYGARRPRPYLYDEQTAQSLRVSSDATMSFFSGHTSTTFAMASSFSYLFTRNHPDSPLVLPIWIGTHAMAATTATMRVAAGRHFWTDVIAGALVGSAIGLLVPFAHDGLLAAVGPDKAIKEARLFPVVDEEGFSVNALFVF